MKPPRRSASHQFSGFLDQGTALSGDLTFSGAVRVDGVIQGSIATPDLLIIGPTSEVQADISVGEVQIHGRLIGDVECSDRVTIHAGGRLEGNVSTPRLIIDEGGQFEGCSRPTARAQGELEFRARPDLESPSSEPVPLYRARWQEIGRSLNRRWGVLAEKAQASVTRRG